MSVNFIRRIDQVTNKVLNSPAQTRTGHQVSTPYPLTPLSWLGSFRDQNACPWIANSAANRRGYQTSDPPQALPASMLVKWSGGSHFQTVTRILIWPLEIGHLERVIEYLAFNPNTTHIRELEEVALYPWTRIPHGVSACQCSLKTRYERC